MTDSGGAYLGILDEYRARKCHKNLHEFNVVVVMHLNLGSEQGMLETENGPHQADPTALHDLGRRAKAQVKIPSRSGHEGKKSWTV